MNIPCLVGIPLNCTDITLRVCREMQSITPTPELWNKLKLVLNSLGIGVMRLILLQ
jgi:hypothetical protein